MDLTLHTTFPECIEAEWNLLLERSHVDTPFLRYEYIWSWWQTRGGGEWKDAELILVSARENGQLVGIAPLFFVPDRKGKPALLLLGSVEVSDYLDLIAAPGKLSDFVAELLPFLASQTSSSSLPHWEILDWCNLLEDSPSLLVLEATARRMGWDYRAERIQPCPYIPLLGDWEAYLASIDKKQRHEIRRKIRRLQESGLPFSWYIVKDAATLDSEIEAFLNLMEQDPQKARFLNDAMREHMRFTARTAFENHSLLLSFLVIDGKKAAVKFCFDYLNRLMAYNSGVEKEFMDLSPGWVLLGYLLRWANENQRSEFDFMRGNEEYKYRFGGINRYVMQITISKPAV